jgi:hypothetical protein
VHSPSRKAMIIGLMLLIAAAHVLPIGRSLQGQAYNLFVSYFSDLVLPFGYYFLLSLPGKRQPIIKRWEVKLALVFTMASVAETCQFYGIPVLGSTFDPLDFLMYGIGCTAAAITDRYVFPRLFTTWSSVGAKG